MRNVRYLILAVLGGFVVTTSACTQGAEDKIEDETRNVVERTADKTTEIAAETADTAKEIAGDIATRTEELAASTGETITDGWITAKVSAKFVDEQLLNGSDINVDTDDHVVNLKGTVASAAAKDRATEIARGTEGVTRVIDQIVVR